MNYLKKYKALIIVIVLGLVSLPSFVKGLKVFAGKQKEDMPPFVKCYQAQLVVTDEKKKEILENELEQLDKLHAEGKINTETYTARKEKLQYQIDHMSDND